MRTWSRGRLHVLSGQCLDLGLGDTRVEPRLNERGARLVQRDLRAQHVEKCRGAKLVATLLHAKVFLRGLDRRQLDLYALLCAAERAQVLCELLLSKQPRVAKLRLGDFLSHARANDLLFARALVEEGEVQPEAHRLRVGITLVSPPE